VTLVLLAIVVGVAAILGGAKLAAARSQASDERSTPVNAVKICDDAQHVTGLIVPGKDNDTNLGPEYTGEYQYS
jgi:hypothetical protein